MTGVEREAKSWKCWVWVGGLGVLLGLFLSATFAQGLRAQTFTLPEHGALTLRIPEQWHSELRQTPGNLPPTLAMRQSSGMPFSVLVTVVWALRAGTQVPNTADIRREVVSASVDAAQHSVERALPLRDLQGSQAVGYYFAATDRSPGPGDFKHLTQGIVHLNTINLAFTILTNDGQDSVVDAALEMLRSAVHEQSGRSTD